MYRVLVTDTLAEPGLQILKQDRAVELDYRPGLNGADLLNAVASCEGLITRSGTAVTRELLSAAKKLRVVGRAGVGLDNVDVDAATERGILVINAPTANIISATEHTMAMMLALCRNLPEADASMKRGEWVRSKFMGVELNGKTLGIIGLGRIGSGVAQRSKAFGMRVFTYDPYIAPAAAERVSAEMVSLDRLLSESDVITVHTPLTDETRGMIAEREYERMKNGVIILNVARGGIYQESALAAALNRGKVAAAALDVYEQEPPPRDHPLLKAKNVVLTPHIGANTIEAQDRVAMQTAEMVIGALKGSFFVSAVNLPFEGIADANSVAMINLAEKLGLLASQLFDRPVTRAGIEIWGIDEPLLKILGIAALKGMLTPHLAESVNFVNAQTVAQTRGIEFSATVHPTPLDYTNLITFRAGSGNQEVSVSGTLFSEKNQRVVAVNGFRVEFKLSRFLIYMVNRDVPGVVGKVGTVLGDREINIAEYNLAREAEGGDAMAVITIDSPVDDETLNFLRSLKEMKEVRLIKL